MELAKHVATWSKDKTTKNGTVIVNEDNIVLSVAYNGFPRDADDEIADRYERPKKYLYTEHAERNCINNAARIGISIKDCTMYTTMFPCVDCCKSIINSGIAMLVTPSPNFDDEQWGESFKIALELLKECGVDIFYYNR